MSYQLKAISASKTDIVGPILLTLMGFVVKYTWQNVLHLTICHTARYDMAYCYDMSYCTL